MFVKRQGTHIHSRCSVNPGPPTLKPGVCLTGSPISQISLWDKVPPLELLTAQGLCPTILGPRTSWVCGLREVDRSTVWNRHVLCSIVSARVSVCAHVPG